VTRRIVNGGYFERPSRKQVPKDRASRAYRDVTDVQVFLNMENRDFTRGTVVKDFLSKSADIVRGSSIYDFNIGPDRMIRSGDRGTAWMSEQPLRENS
jgi:hypothetical protein